MEMGERKAEIFVNSNVTCSPSVWKYEPVLHKELLASSTSSSFTGVDSHACMNHWNEGGRPHRFKPFNCLWVQATVTVKEVDKCQILESV